MYQPGTKLLHKNLSDNMSLKDIQILPLLLDLPDILYWLSFDKRILAHMDCITRN